MFAVCKKMLLCKIYNTLFVKKTNRRVENC